MSLDVWLTVETPRPKRSGSGIWFREGGQQREISREEWDAAFPGREPIVAVEDEGESGVVFDRNITHNLNTMAGEAGVYDACWRPYRIVDPERGKLADAQAAAGRYHEPDGAHAIELSIPPAHARDLIVPLKSGLALLKSDPDRFKKHNPENGWGNYENLVEFVADYLAACEQWPEAVVGVSR